MHANDADHSIQDGRLRRHFVFRRESYKTFSGSARGKSISGAERYLTTDAP